MIQKKICMVGRPSVGKTSLVARYVHSIFSDKYLSTVGVKIDKKSLVVQDTELTLMVWDLAGDDDFQRLQPSYLRGSSGYLLVADGTRAPTLEQAIEIQGRVVQAIGPAPFVLVLNKSDLKNQWELEQTQLDDLACQGWTVQTTSAKDGSGVEAAFYNLSALMLNTR